jgi:hypothetical protein
VHIKLQIKYNISALVRDIVIIIIIIIIIFDYYGIIIDNGDNISTRYRYKCQCASH